MDHQPKLGEANLAALAALVVGSIGGLFALGSVPAIVTRQPQYLATAPVMNIISFFLCGAIGWILGGQIGPRLTQTFGIRNGQLIGGVIGGIIPVLGIAGLGWYLTQPA
jgi:hypothetical protein